MGPGSGMGTGSSSGSGVGTGSGSGTGSGTGADSGSGSGVGTGWGSGSGVGIGSGTGTGTGTTSGCGSGAGTGTGAGTGSGMGIGSGSGVGAGMGTVSASGSGSGPGSGSGMGTGPGSGVGRGVGTASAFGPIFIDWGAPESATTVGVTAGTLGNIMGSLIGGPVAAFLISRHHLKADPNDKPEAAADGKINELSNSRMVSMFGMVLLLCALGMPIYCILDNIPMIEMPKFIGCLFAGAIARNVMEAAHIKFYTPEVDALEHMFLELYLALVLMTIDITALADVAGQMGIILLLQAALMALFAIFVSYNMFGRNYGAAVMAAGNCGWGCGSGPNAVANEKAVMDQYGWHNVAWVLYPSFAVIIDDIYNPIFLSVFGGLLAH